LFISEQKVIASVADQKLFISDTDPTCQVIMDPDPDPDPTRQVITVPDPDLTLKVELDPDPIC